MEQLEHAFRRMPTLYLPKCFKQLTFGRERDRIVLDWVAGVCAPADPFQERFASHRHGGDTALVMLGEQPIRRNTPFISHRPSGHFRCPRIIPLRLNILTTRLLQHGFHGTLGKHRTLNEA